MLSKITLIQKEIERLHHNLYDIAKLDEDMSSPALIAVTQELDKTIFCYFCIVNSLQIAPDNLATKWCTSRIEKITNKYMVIDASRITIPKLLALLPGSYLSGEVTIDNIAYAFTCELLEKKVTYPDEWVVSLPYDIKQFQRRRFVRSDSQILIQIGGVAGKENNAYQVTCLTNDIGGGGLSFLSDEPYDLAARLNLNLYLSSARIIKAVGEVVRVVPKRAKFLISMKFIQIREADRDKIIGYVLKRLADKVK